MYFEELRSVYTHIKTDILWVDYSRFVLYINNEKVITDVTANDDHWHHLGVTWNSVNGEWQIYKDGVLEDSGEGLASGSVIIGNILELLRGGE